MAFIPTGITSIVNTVPSSVQVGASIMGTVPVTGNVFINGSVATVGSITALQGTNPWQVNMPSPSVIAYQAAGSILAVSGSFSSGNTSVQLLGGVAAIGSVAVLQGTNPWQVNVPTPSYISYQLAGSVMAVAATVNTGNSSVQLLGGVAAIGSVATLQGTNPWIVNVPTPSYISYQLAGSVMAVAATVNTGNSSVQLLSGVGVIGSVAVLQGTDPWKVNVPTPSYISYQLAGSVMAVNATVNTGNSSVQVISSVAVVGTMSVLGTVPVTQSTTPWIIGSILGTYLEKNAVTPSVFGIPTLFKIDETNSVLSAVSPQSPLPVRGSVAALQGTNPWIINMPSPSVVVIHPAGSVVQVRTDNASIIAVLSTSSVAALQGTNPWQVGIVSGSIVGTYAEDSGHVSGDKGFLAFGVRNDTVASLVNADLDYGAWAQDSSGRHLVKPFVSEDGTIITYNSSITSTSVTLIAASVTGKRSYVTDFWIANSGSVAAIVQFRENTTSVIATTMAPAGGGSNSQGINVPIKTSNQNLDLSIVGLTASSILYVTVKGYQAP